MDSTSQLLASWGAEQATRAAAAVAVAIFAYRDATGRPLAWPVMPYVDGDEIIITSTLAFARKAAHVRSDGRVALLAGGIHMTGEATVEVDLRGDRFVANFLDQELEKYPPAADIVGVPFSRLLFWWFFGRVFIRFVPRAIDERPGDDAATLVRVDDLGFPSIAPIMDPPIADSSFRMHALGQDPGIPSQGVEPAAVLLHSEPTLRDLRQLLLRGETCDEWFHRTSRQGSLEPASGGGAIGELLRQIGYQRRALRSRKLLRAWALEDRAS